MLWASLVVQIVKNMPARQETSNSHFFLKNKGIILALNILIVQLEFMFYKFKVKAKLFK